MCRRVLSLMLILQMLLTQLGQVHGHASYVHGGGTTSHVHLSLPPEPSGHHHCHHGHSHADHSHAHPHSHGHHHDGDDESSPCPFGEEGDVPCPGHDHDADAYQLPDGWHAQRPSIRPLGGLLVIAFVPPDRLDFDRLLAGVGDAHGVPPDPEPPALPVYLRTLHILV